MVKGNSFEMLASNAADRIKAAQAAGEQLTFLPDEPVDGAGGRAPRGKGKAQSQLRDWLAARGMRLPEDVLTEMAGMVSTEDVFVTAMARTEQLLGWAQAGAVGYKGAPVAPSMAQRLAAFQFVFTAMLRAAEALLPYGLAKVTPDANTTVVNTIVMPGATAGFAPGAMADRARDVTPAARKIAPPPLPHEMQQNQGLKNPGLAHSDAEIRTDEVKR